MKIGKVEINVKALLITILVVLALLKFCGCGRSPDAKIFSVDEMVSIQNTAKSQCKDDCNDFAKGIKGSAKDKDVINKVCALGCAYYDRNAALNTIVVIQTQK